MTLLKDNNYKEINVALLSLEADIKKLSNNGSFDTSVIDKQLAEINSRIDKINAGNNNSSAEINDIRTEIENINSKLIGNSVRIENIEQKLSDIFSADNEVTDFNTTTNSGIYYWLGSSANKPGTDYGVLLVNKYDGGDGTSNLWVNQIAYGTNNKIYFRQNINSGNWTKWKAVAFEGEITASKVANALTVNGRTYDGSSAVDAGVQAVEYGGTGCDTAEGAANFLIASLSASDSVPVDTDFFISQMVNGGPFVPAYNRRPISKLWEYIKGKILQEGEEFGYNHIVYNDASLLEWANCTDGSMKKVLVKSGTYNMTKGVDFSKAGTGYVFAENGAVINSKVPIAFTAPSGKTVVHNLKVVCGPGKDNTCAFSANDVLNLILYDCEAGYATNTITADRNLFSKCTCYNCHYYFTNSSANSSISIKVFYQCYCYNCICKQTISANSSTGIIFDSDSYFYRECHCSSCDAELTTLRNIKAATAWFTCYYNCWDRCIGCLSTINVNSSSLTVYSTLYGFFRCQHMSSCKEVHTVGYTNIKGVVQCIYISSTSAVTGESNTNVGNSCDI